MQRVRIRLRECAMTVWVGLLLFSDCDSCGPDSDNPDSGHPDCSNGVADNDNADKLGRRARNGIWQRADHKVLIRDVASVEGIRNNSLIGYGLVVGLKGTGDKQQTYFTIQTLASILQRMGVEIPPIGGAIDGAGEKRGGGVCDRQSASVCAAGHAARRAGFVRGRCAQPRRRTAAADAAVCGRWAGVCGGARTAGGGRICGGVGGQLEAGESSHGRDAFRTAD